MTHTPGPWRVHSEHADRIIVNGCCVYQVGNLAVSGSYEPGVLGAPSPDDVRLMAAAPDLLEALRNLENDDGSIPNPIWRLVKAAIAKAERRTDDQ